jgi:hypothetical protein
MAIKITAALGTDRGITKEAYLRIADYQISKSGWASLRLELYQSEADAKHAGAGIHGSMINQARNQQIGESLWVPLTKEIEEVVVEKQMVPVEVSVEVSRPGEPDADGNPTTITTTETRTEMQEKEVEVTYKKVVPDLSPVKEADVFVFGYSKLKEKMIELFGKDSVVDC